MILYFVLSHHQLCYRLLCGGTAAAALPTFRPGKPALCGSRPLVTPYYCRLARGLAVLYIHIFLACAISYFCVYYVLCVVFVFL